MKKQKGISVIELLLVIGVILTMTGIIIAIKNPVVEQAKYRNWQREIDIREIAQVIHQIKIHSKDNKFPKTDKGEDIPKCAENSIEVSKLKSVLVPDYLTTIPTDPKTKEESYKICIEGEEQIKVTADQTELNQEISFPVFAKHF